MRWVVSSLTQASSNAGRVLVYQLLVAPTPSFFEIRDYVGSTPEGAFGTSLSYRGDGDLLAVGAPGNASTSGAVIVIDDSDANYSAVSANLAAGESPYEYKFSSAIFSDNSSQFNDSTDNSYHGSPENAYEFIEIPAYSLQYYFGVPVLKFDGTETTLQLFRRTQVEFILLTDHQAEEHGPLKVMMVFHLRFMIVMLIVLILRKMEIL